MGQGPGHSSKPAAHCQPLPVKQPKEMHLGVCTCFCGSRTRGGADKAGHPFPVSRNHSLCFKRDKPAFPRNILRFFALFAGSRPFLHSCPHGLLGGTALRHLALTLLPENSREDSDDLRNGQPGCRPQAPSSHLCAFHKEGGSPPGLCPKGDFTPPASPNASLSRCLHQELSGDSHQSPRAWPP